MTERHARMKHIRDPFEFTATGVLGDRRETMLENEILLRTELAKPINRGYSKRFPGSRYTYGICNVKRDGGVAEALGKWDYVKLSQVSKQDKPSERDYLKLNKAAVMKGLVTLEEHKQFQNINNWRQPVLDPAGLRMPVKKLSPNTVYGRPVRPSTPINDIMEHRFQDRWIEKQRKKIVAGIHSRNLWQMKSRKAMTQDTRASLLRVFQAPVKEPPLWQMPRFTKTARPQLETFRGCGEKNEAMKTAAYDRATRRGVVCAGVYEQAKQ